MANEPVPKIPFRLAARQHFTQVATKPFVANSPVRMDFPAVGWLARVIVSVRGTVTPDGSQSTILNSTEQVYNLIRRFRVEANGGQLNIMDLKGFSVFLASNFLERGFRLDAPGAGSAAVDPEFQRGWLPTGGSATQFRLTYVLPISAGNGSNFDTGLINLQAEELVLTLNMDCGAAADLYATHAPALDNLQIDVGYLWWEQPDANRVQLPRPTVVRLTDQVQAAITGENRIKAIRQGTLMQQIVALKCDGAYVSESIDSIGITLNKNSVSYLEKGYQNRLTNRIQLGTDLPAGIAAYDFYHATQAVSEGDSRDMFDLEQYANFETIVNVPSGLITNAATSTLTTINRTLNQLQG